MALVESIEIEFADPENRRAAIEQMLFGGGLEDHDYDALAGICLPGVSLRVAFDFDLTGVRFPLCLRARRSDEFSTTILFEPQVVTLHSMNVSQQFRGQGIGRETFYYQARSAQARGCEVIRGKALRFEEGTPQGFHDGYFKAVQWGFDGPIPADVHAQLPESLAHCERVAELMGSDAGVTFWRENGATVDVEFRLDDPEAWNRLGTPG